MCHISLKIGAHPSSHSIIILDLKTIGSRYRVSNWVISFSQTPTTALNIQRAPLLCIDLGAIEIGKKKFHFPSTPRVRVFRARTSQSSEYLLIEHARKLTTSMDFMMVGQYFLADAAPAPNVYLPDESVCSASPAMFRCEISVDQNEICLDSKQSWEISLELKEAFFRIVHGFCYYLRKSVWCTINRRKSNICYRSGVQSGSL